jgi:hypothetical protein
MTLLFIYLAVQIAGYAAAFITLIRALSELDR